MNLPLSAQRDCKSRRKTHRVLACKTRSSVKSVVEFLQGIASYAHSTGNPAYGTMMQRPLMPLMPINAAETENAERTCAVSIRSKRHLVRGGIPHGPPALVVNLGGSDVFVVEQILYGPDRHAGVEQQGCRGGPQGVRRLEALAHFRAVR
jgi:hypothetical protein